MSRTSGTGRPRFFWRCYSDLRTTGLCGRAKRRWSALSHIWRLRGPPAGVGIGISRSEYRRTRRRGRFGNYSLSFGAHPVSRFGFPSLSSNDLEKVATDVPLFAFAGSFRACETRELPRNPSGMRSRWRAAADWRHCDASDGETTGDRSVDDLRCHKPGTRAGDQRRLRSRLSHVVTFDIAPDSQKTPRTMPTGPSP